MNPRPFWHLIEPIHAAVYYAPEVFAESAALGYAVDTRWPSYFALRGAPLGRAGTAAVASAFYSFSTPRVPRTKKSAAAAKKSWACSGTQRAPPPCRWQSSFIAQSGARNRRELAREWPHRIKLL